MNNKIVFRLGALAGFGVAAIFLVIAVWVWQFVFASALPVYQSTVPQASANPSDLPELTSRVDKMENDLAFTMRDVSWRMDQKLLIFSGVASLISAIAAFLGYKTFKDLDETIKSRINSTLQKELYQLDPTNIPIHIQSGQGMENIHRRLQLSGLKNLSFYERLDKHCVDGITILAAPDESAQKKFRDFIETYEPDPQAAAYILYAPPGSVSAETLNCYENLVTANFPATVVSMVLVVGRGIRPQVQDTKS